MKSMVTVERISCDTCGAEAHKWTCCSWCGADVCYDHRTQHRRELFINSSEDPGSCPSCEARIKADPTLLGPLAQIEHMRAEMERWNADFKRRYEAAQEAARGWSPKGATC